MTKDAKDNKRGCIVIAAIVALLTAALVWGIATSQEDPRVGATRNAEGAVAPVDPAS